MTGPARPLALHHFVQRYPPALGGSERYFERLSRHLAGRGHAVTVWTTTADELEAFWSPAARQLAAGESAADGVRVRRYAPLHWPGRRYLLKAASLVPAPAVQAMTLPCNPVSPAMWRDAGRFAGPCDAVHAAAFPYAWPIACALRLARRRGVPFFLTPFLHLGDPSDPRDRTRRQYTQPALRRFLRLADRVFTQTPSERDAAVRLGVPPERVALQGLGVDPAEATGGDRSRAREAWGVGDGEFVVGHLANNSVEKGTVDLLRAAGLAGCGRVVLAGPGMPNFRRFWDDFAGKARVTRLGPLTEAAKRDFFAGIDAFALPSRSDSFGLVLLEAWANGVPNLAYRAGGPADLIRHQSDGWLAPCGDVAALAEGLRRFGQDAEFRRRCGEEGRRRVRMEFRWDDKLACVERELPSVKG